MTGGWPRDFLGLWYALFYYQYMFILNHQLKIVFQFDDNDRRPQRRTMTTTMGGDNEQFFGMLFFVT